MLTPLQSTSPYTPDLNEKQLEAQVQELMCYLWDNYLQLYDDAEELFIMGVGHAYIGVKMLLLNRGESAAFLPNSEPDRQSI